MSQEESALDAMNTALSGETPEVPEPELETETPEVEAPAEESETEGEVPEGEPAAEAPEETDAEAKARGAERGPDGKFKKKEAEAPAEVEKPKVEAKKTDPINDPMPAGLKKEAQDRFKTLVETAKTATAERDQVKQDFDYLIKGVEATGATPEQYGETLSWLSLFNSQDPRQQEKALELVETVAERLATLLGKERSVGDPLSAHTDLKDAVTKGQITAQYAKEIARTRNGQQFRQELSTNASQENQRQQQAAQELHTARSGLSALEETLRNSDPQYEAKKAILVSALKPVFASIPPSQWVQKFQESYKALNVGAPKAAASAKAPANQPLRAGKQPAGGQTKAPGSMLDAVSAALAGMGK